MKRLISGVILLVLAGAALACANGGESDSSGSDATAAATSPTAPLPSPVAPTPDPSVHFRNSWPETDFSRVNIDLGEILSGGVPIDGIPPLDAEGATTLPGRNTGVAKFEPVAAVELSTQMPVAFMDIEGDARAYPLHILTWHEVVNDVVGGRPVAVTFCPLCNTVVAFDREVDGQVLDFGVSGLLRHSDLVMWDRQTHSWWQQATGEGIVGTHAGTQLSFLSAGIISFGDFRERFPGGVVLSEDTEMGRTYGQNPYVGYDAVDRRPFLFNGEIDERLAPMERVVSLDLDGEAMAVPFSELRNAPVASFELGGQDIVVFWAPGTTSALDDVEIADSTDIGAAVAYSAVVDGELLRFEPLGDGQFRDLGTGSTWTVAGNAVDGALAGSSLEVVPHTNIFWFAWAAFVPETSIWTAT